MVRISLDLPDDVAAALERAAGEMQSTREAVLLAAARGFLAERDGFDAFIEDRQAFAAWVSEGRADVAAGRTVSLDEAAAELDGIIDRARAARD